MRRFALTLGLFGMAVTAAFAAPRLMPAPVREMHVAPAPVAVAPAPVAAPVAAPIPEVQVGTLVTIPELGEPRRPARPLPLALPPDPPQADPCPACGMG